MDDGTELCSDTSSQEGILCQWTCGQVERGQIRAVSRSARLSLLLCSLGVARSVWVAGGPSCLPHSLHAASRHREQARSSHNRNCRLVEPLALSAQPPWRSSLPPTGLLGVSVTWDSTRSEPLDHRNRAPGPHSQLCPARPPEPAQLEG